MTQTNLRKLAITTSTLACSLLLSFVWSAQRGISLSIESAQAQTGRSLTPPSVAGDAHHRYWRAAYGYGAGVVAAGPWDYYGGSPCDYERTIGGYYRGAGWDRYWLCGPGGTLVRGY